jgi:hypothetical protein
MILMQMGRHDALRTYLRCRRWAAAADGRASHDCVTARDAL